MRGWDERTGSLFSYVDLEDRVPAKHPLRVIWRIVNDVLAALDGEFAKIYADSGRPSIPPERLLRALLLQAFYTIRSETQLIEQLDYNLLYRWFVGLGSTSQYGCRRYSRRTANGCWRRRLRTSSWPNF
jgi:transposase